jgi:hypothetical protein
MRGLGTIIHLALLGLILYYISAIAVMLVIGIIMICAFGLHTGDPKIKWDVKEAWSITFDENRAQGVYKFPSHSQVHAYLASKGKGYSAKQVEDAYNRYITLRAA